MSFSREQSASYIVYFLRHTGLSDSALERHPVVESASANRLCTEKPSTPSTVTVSSQLSFQSNEINRKESIQRNNIGVIASCSVHCSAGLDFSASTGVDQNAVTVSENSTVNTLLDLNVSVSQLLSTTEISTDHKVVGSASEDNQQSIEQIDNRFVRNFDAVSPVASTNSSIAPGKNISILYLIY